MKKATLLIVLMLIMSLTAFAEFDVAVSGSADMTFGVNLNDPAASGITNATSSSISFSLVSGDSEKGGDSDVYGYIKVAGWGASVGNDGIAVAPGGVEAKIMLPGGAWVDITGAMNALDYTAPLQDDDGDDDAADTGVSTELGKSGGLTIGIPAGPATIALGIFSANDWVDGDAVGATYSWQDDDDDASTPAVWTMDADSASDDVANTDNEYGMSVKITGAAAMINFDVAAVFGLSYAAAQPTGIAANIGAAFGPASVYVKTDAQLNDGVDALYDLGAGLALAISGITLGVDVSMSDAVTADNVDMKISLGIGMVENLTASVAVNLNDVDVAATWDLTVDLSYMLATAKPYVTFKTNDAGVNGLKIGAELYVIENVTLTVDYDSDDLENNNGVLTIKTAISL